MAILNSNKALSFIFKISLFLPLLYPVTAFSASLDQVKTAFLFNFANYVSWPDASFQSSDSAFTFCLDADKDFIELMQITVKDEMAQERYFSVIALSDISKIQQCQIIYIAATRDYKASIAAIKPLMPILSISDHEDFSMSGGMIELKQQDQRLKLLVNLKTVEKAGLSIRSNLLNVVTIVE